MAARPLARGTQIPPTSRIGGAKKHFGQEWSTGQMVVAGVVISLVIAFAIFLAVSALQHNRGPGRGRKRR